MWKGWSIDDGARAHCLRTIAPGCLTRVTHRYAAAGCLSSPEPRFAAYILGGFFGLGILVLAMVLLNLRPKRVDPPAPDP